MPGFLTAPWLTLALLAGWFFAQQVFALVFILLRLLLDWIYSDSMPDSTHGLIRRELRARGLDHVLVGRGPRNMTGFFPLTGLIWLDGRTYQKRDPIFWAIGLHELGHVLLHRVAIFGLPLRLARQVWLGLGRFRKALVLGLLIYGGSLAQAWVGAVLLVTLGAGVLIVLDEVVASVIALVVLARTGAVGVWQTFGAALLLSFALATYVGTFGADLLLYLHLDAVAAIAAEFPTAMRSPLPGVVALIVLALITLVILVYGVIEVALPILAPKQWAKLEIGDAEYLVTVFVLMTWNRAGGEGLHLACALALPIALRGLISLLGLLAAAALQNVSGFRGWARAKAEDAGELALLSLAELERSFLLRLVNVLPWVAALTYVVWYWVAWIRL